MKHLRFAKPNRLLAGLLSGFLLAIVAVPLSAKTAAEATTGRGFGPVYDVAHEITLNGTIQQVVTKRTPGSPAGMHLLVAGPQGLVDAHVGPFLRKEIKTALRAGMSVRIIGTNTSLHGKNYFLARQLTVGQSVVTVRSERGILIREHSARGVRSRGQQSSQLEPNGGAR